MELTKMKNAELVALYNKLVNENPKLKLKPVKRFADKKSAIKRIEALPKPEKTKKRTSTEECEQIWDKMVTKKLNCTRMDYIKACEKKSLSRWIAVGVWGKRAVKHGISNPTQTAKERNKNGK